MFYNFLIIIIKFYFNVVYRVGIGPIRFFPRGLFLCVINYGGLSSLFCGGAICARSIQGIVVCTVIVLGVIFSLLKIAGDLTVEKYVRMFCILDLVLCLVR